MRTLRTVPFFAVAMLMTSCVPSLYPLYTERDLVFERALVGNWIAEDDGHKSIWTVTRSKEGSEIVDVEENEEPARFDVRMVKLGEHTFLDLYPAKQEINNGLYQLHLIRAHTFMKVTLTEDSFSVAMLDSDWLTKSLKEEGTSLATQELSDGTLLLTAP